MVCAAKVSKKSEFYFFICFKYFAKNTIFITTLCQPVMKLPDSCIPGQSLGVKDKKEGTAWKTVPY